MTRLFELDPQLIMDTIQLAASVFVLFTILSYLLFNPVRKVLENRQERIQNDIRTAETDREETAVLKAEYENKLKTIHLEAEHILNEARKKALRNENRIVEDANLEAERILKRAAEEAELEHHRAMDNVKKEMIEIAAMMAEKVITSAINVSVNEALLEDTLKEMGERKCQS